MAFGHEQREPVVRVVLDQVEVAGRVSVSEVARPAAQVPVEVLHDLLDGEQQPFSHGELTDTIAGALHRPLRGPAGEELDMLDAVGAHPPMVEAEEVHCAPRGAM